MYCKKCGKEIRDDSQFCAICGADQGSMKKEAEDATEGGKLLGSIVKGAFAVGGSFAATVGAVVLQEPIKEVTNGVSKKIIEYMKDKGLIEKTLWDKMKDIPGKLLKK